MTVESNRALIEGYFVAIGGRSERPIDQYFTDDVTWKVPQSNPMFPENPLRGLAAVMELLGSGVNIYRPGSMMLDMQALICDDERVCAQFTLDAVLANGEAYSNHYVMVFEIENDRISAVYEYLDTLYQSSLGAFEGEGESGDFPL